MKSPLIFLVENEIDLRDVFAMHLAQAGYTVLPAANGIEALQAVQTQRPDLVISDVLMAEMDGYELARRLRDEPLCSAIPIVLYSGTFADDAAMRLARSLGVRHFLTKPFTPEKLLTAVSEALRRRDVPSSAPPEQLEGEHKRLLLEKLTEKVAALEATEERFRQLVATAATVLLYLSPQYRILEFNSEAERLFARKRSEVLGKDFVQLFVPEGERGAVVGHFQKVLAGEPSRSFVTPVLAGDGGQRFVSWNVNRGQGRPGQPDGIVAIGVDFTERKRAENEIVVRARQQQAVAELSQHALSNVSLAALFDETVILVARGLGVKFCKVLELLPDKSGLKLVSGVGWHPGSVGQAVVGIGSDSQAGYTLHCENPIIVEDLRTEKRFRGPALLHDHGVVSGISVLIGTPERPWGVLGAHSSDTRRFTEDDVNFLQSVAHVLGMAIHRDETERSLLEVSARLMYAEDAERRRIAKELHDSTAQDLVAVMLNIESLRDAAIARDPAEALMVEDSIALLENCAHEIRTLSYLLHPPRLDEAGILGAVRHYAAGFEKRTGIVTSVDLPESLERLGETVEMVLFRVVQECLGNVHRHSGSATASVRLKRDASGIVLEVCDEGGGIPPRSPQATADPLTALGVGIPGMRERLRHIGGHLEVVSSPRGTTVRAVVPGHQPRRADILSAGPGGILPHGPLGKDAP